MLELDLSRPFARFDRQDSGCAASGVVHDGQRLFVKVARTAAGAESLRRAMAFHAAVRHPAIVGPIEANETPAGPRVTYPWHDGLVLNAATVGGADRAGLDRFQALPVAEAEAAITTILDAHLAVAAAGFVAVDLYDGCFLYDFEARATWLIDLDEYRPGPFTVDGDRLPGSLRYMAPEELRRGGTIDERTTVFVLGRVVHHLLSGPAGWRGTSAQAGLVTAATAVAPRDRLPTVAALVASWRRTTRSG